MADNSYKNSIMLGVRLPQANDIQSQLNSLIKELNNSKIQLDVGFKDNSIVQTIEKLNNILNQTKQSANNVNLSNISNVLKQVSQEATKLSGDLKNVSSVNLKVNDGELKSLKVTMQDTENETKKLNQSLKDTGNSNWFSGMGDFLSKAGLFYGVGQAVSELKQQFTGAFEQAERLNTAFTDISITMDITKEQFADMSNKITQMGIEYGRSGNEIMNIAKTYSNAQSSVEEVMQKVKPDLFLSNVSRIDSADITKTIQSVTNQFGLMTKEGMSAEQATMKVANSLVATSKNMQFDFVDGIKKITEAVKVGGSIAENSKMSLDDFISMTGAFVQQSGMSGAEFSNSLKMVSARILKQKELGAELGLQAKDYAEAENALKRFDITTRDTTTGGLRSLTDILKDTSVAFSKMTDSDRQYMANKLAGVNQSARFIDIMKSMQNQQVLYNATQTDTIALMDAQAKYADSLEGRIGSLKATYEGLQNKMLTSDTAKFLVTEATQFLNVLSNIDTKTVAFVGTVGLATVAISKLSTMNKLLMAEQAGEGVATGFTHLMGVLTGMTPLVGTTTVATQALATAETEATIANNALAVAQERLILATEQLALVQASESASAFELSVAEGEVMLATNALTVAQGEATVATEALTVAQASASAEQAGLTGLTGAWTLLKGGIISATESAIAFMMTPLGLAITAISVAVGIGAKAWYDYKQHEAEVEAQSKSLKDAINGVNEALKNGDTKGASNQLDKVAESEKKYQDALEKRKKLEAEIKDTQDNMDSYNSDSSAIKLNQLNSDLQEVNKQISTQEEELKKAGISAEDYATAQEKVANAKIVDSIKEQAKTQIENRDNLESAKQEVDNYISSVKNLYSQYQNLSAQENLSAEQKKQLGNVVAGLQDHISNLNVKMDENGKAYISNEPLITDTIGYLDNEGLTINSLSQIRTQDAKATSTWQVNNTQITYAEVVKRINLYKAEIQAIQAMLALKAANASAGTEWAKINEDDSPELKSMKISSQGAELNSQYREYDKANPEFEAKRAELEELQKVQKLADETYKNISIPNAPSKGGGDYLTASPDTSGGSKKSKADTEAEKAQKLREEIDALQSDIKPDRYLDLNNAIKSLDGELEVNKSLQDSLEKGSPEYRQAQQQEIDLDKQKQVALQNLNNEQKKEAQEMKDRLSSMSFQFDANGRLINSQQRLLEMQESINAESGDTEEAKKKKQDDIKWLKDLQKYTQDYTNLIGDKIPKTTAEWNKLGNEIKNTVGDMEKADEDALQKLRENLVDGLKKQREKEKEDELEALETSYDRKKKRIQAEYDEEKKRLEDQKSALQKQISDLEDSKEDKAGKLAELQKEYEGWSRDNSSYAKKNKDDLAKEIKDLTIDIQKDTLQKQVDSIDEQEKDTDTYYKNELSNAEEHYNKMKKKKETYYKNLLDDKQLYADSDVLITKNSNDEMLKILNDSSESYKQVGTLLGENFKDGLLKQLNEAKEALKDLQNIKAEKASSGGSSGSSSSSGGSSRSHKTTYNDDGSKTTTGTTSEGISYTKETSSSGDSVVYASKPFDTSEISSYATGGMTPSNISNNGALAVLHKDEKILNADDTIKFDDSMEKIKDIYSFIMNSGSLISQLSQTYANPNNYTMPSIVNSDLNRAVSGIVNNNNNGGNISANFYNTFNNTISSNVDANKFNNDAVKQLKSELNYISNRFIK